MPSLSLDWCLWEEGSILQWRDDCLFDSSGLQTIALRIHLFLLFWASRRGFFNNSLSLGVSAVGVCTGLGLQGTDVATTGSPAPPSLTLVPRVPSLLLPVLGMEPQLSQLLSILPPGCSFAPRAELWALRVWNWAPSSWCAISLLVQWSQQSMEAHSPAKATLSPVKPMVLSLHLWSLLLGISVYRNVQLSCLLLLASLCGRGGKIPAASCPPVLPFKGLNSRRTLIWGSPAWDFSLSGTRSVSPGMCAGRVHAHRLFLHDMSNDLVWELHIKPSFYAAIPKILIAYLLKILISLLYNLKI